MDEITLQKLEEITDIKQFIEFISVYYPDLSFNSYTIGEIERALFHTYIKIIGNILGYSPLNMRIFLKNYLMKYEIMNIKHIILGTILGMTIDEKSSMVNKLVERYLNKTEFIKDLIELSSLDEIQLYLKPTIYNKVVREGILYFKNTNEIFVLETFLDQLYFSNLKDGIKLLNPKEKDMISFYMRYTSEIYNLNIIYRGIKNDIDRNLLLQFLVDIYLFLDKNILNNLLKLTNIEELFIHINQHLSRVKEIKSYSIYPTLDKEHFIWSIEKLYLNYYFKKFKIKIEDIEYQSIFKILEILIKKDQEIRLYILPKVVKILHEKYTLLK